MFKRLLICCILKSCFVISIQAQLVWKNLEVNIENDENLSELEQQYEELSELAEHPFNINTITKEELEQLPFLSDQLIENILYYVYKYGPLLSEKELLGVEGMDWQTRDILQNFIYIGDSGKQRNRLDLKDIMKYNKQELITRVDVPFNQKAGYADYSKTVLKESPNKKYMGNPVYHNVRYKFQYGQQLFVGITAEKDSGEPFFTGHNKKGYDYYGFYMMLQNVANLKTLVIGNYKASFGYGLVMNMNNFSLGKSGIGNNIRFGKGFSKHASTDEYNYLQGLGVTYRLSKRWDMSAFYSYRKMDGNAEDMFIKTLKTDGFHRLKKDMEKKNMLSNHLIGCNLTYNGKFVEYGLTAVYNKFNKMLNPDFRPYNKYYPRGKSFFNVGGFYKFFLNRFTFSGEAAIDKCGKLSMLHIISYSPDVNNRIIFMNRYYDVKYQTLYGNAFGENSRMQNELGFYLGLESSILSKIKLSGYIDLFHFPYLKYRVDHVHTTGFDTSVRIDYSPINSLTMLIKYNCKNKPLNFQSDNGEKYVLANLRHRLHSQFLYDMNSWLSLKTSLEYIRTGFYGLDKSSGFYISESVKMDIPVFPLKVAFSSAWFSTDDTSSKIYMYEPGILYSFSMYSFYGKGSRHAFNLVYEWKDKLSVHTKLGWTHYTDRNKIGTGLEEIDGNNKLDLQLQLKLKW